MTLPISHKGKIPHAHSCDGSQSTEGGHGVVARAWNLSSSGGRGRENWELKASQLSEALSNLAEPCLDI